MSSSDRAEVADGEPDDPFGTTFVQPGGHAFGGADFAPDAGDRADAAAKVVDAERRLANYAKADAELAVAAVLVGGGHVGERELAKATADWTVHGDRRLFDHLVAAGLVSPGDRAEVFSQAADRLARASASQASSGKTTLGQTLAGHIDKAGKVSKALGLGDNSVPLDAGEARQLAARYTLLRKLGQGGLGTVWLARDEALNRFVAVKEVRVEATADPAAVARFRREAEVTGRLEHPGIVPIYQFGTDAETGNLFYAMRFLGKQTLADAIAEYHERREAGVADPMLLNRLLTAFVSVCQSVAHAHSRKIVHRDLKPENVALDSFGQVVLLDWGLAKINDETGVYEAAGGQVESGDVHDSGATMAGQVLGTPGFMAPEQAAGRLDEIDERTDIYGLGAILFAVLTGSGPHDASRMRASRTLESSGGSKAGPSLASVLTAIVSGETPRARDFNESVPQSLDAIAAKAMAKRPFLRYETASALADDVQCAMVGQTVSAMPDTTAVQLRRWVQEHPRTARVGGAVAALALVAFTTWGISARQSVLAEQRRGTVALRNETAQVEAGLRAHAIELRQDVRFLSGLPPIQGIIDARSNRETDPEPVWHTRLQKIFALMLDANPSYLSVAYLASNIEADEIVRVERGRAGEAARVVPGSRLRSYTLAGRSRQLLTIPPGEADVDHAPLFPVSSGIDTTRTVVTAAVPVYDDMTGRPFGLVAVTTAPGDYVGEIVTAAVRSARSVALTDETGTVLVALDADGGERPEFFGADVASVLPPPAEGATVGVETVRRVIPIPHRRGVGEVRIYVSAAELDATSRP
ncbi:MAG: serine/threonine-protein kinase [Planctomycetota bacterium]